jgi:hypothetical protein
LSHQVAHDFAVDDVVALGGVNSLAHRFRPAWRLGPESRRRTDAVAPYYAYASPACAWQPGYWVNQPYVDAYGRFTNVTQWVPGQWICP